MFAYKTLKSGTDIRGVASEGGGAPINLTDEVVERIAAGFLVWCEKHLDKCAEGLKIAVGHDSRISADRIAAALFRASAARFAALFAHALPVDVHDKQQHRKDNDKHQNKFQNAENHRAALRAARFRGCTAFGRGRFRTAGGGLCVACSAHSRRVCGVAGFIRFRCRCHGVKEL